MEPFHQARADVVARFEKAISMGSSRRRGKRRRGASQAGLDRKNLWLKAEAVRHRTGAAVALPPHLWLGRHTRTV